LRRGLRISEDEGVFEEAEVPFRLLERIPEASVGEDSGNVIVHGDNLEALKALLPYYRERVKLVFIDPPYNTGNENTLALCQQQEKKRLLGMQPILSLVEDATLRAVYDVRRDLLAAVGGKAVEEGGVRGGKVHQLLVHLIGSELLLSLLGLALPAHAGPHVGVDDPRAGGGLVGVTG
jgi:hypothetical protein